MRRRDVMYFVAGAIMLPAFPSGAAAEEPARIGYLSPGGFSARDEAFRHGLHELGYVEGRNIVIEYRFAEGQFERLSELAAELVALDVEVLVSVVTQASLAAKEATGTVPIVMVAVSDPVASGLVSNLARPGGNITGTSSMNADVIGKALELLKEAMPAVQRVAVMWNQANAVFQRQLLQQAKRAAAGLNIRLHAFGTRGTDDFKRVFAAIAATEALDALLVMPDPIFILHKAPIIEFANKSQIPAIYSNREYAAGGGLMSYGPDIEDQFRRAAAHVDKILRGAEPADLAVEQPREFAFVINLKTARALGIEIPPSLLARADEVIE